MQFNLNTASLNILQIPRDTYMPAYSSEATKKFNSIYNGGTRRKSKIQRVVNAVQESFGIPVDAYVTTTCDNIVDIVDIVGGIPIDMPLLPDGIGIIEFATTCTRYVQFRLGYSFFPEISATPNRLNQMFPGANFPTSLSMNGGKTINIGEDKMTLGWNTGGFSRQKNRFPLYIWCVHQSCQRQQCL